MIGETEEPFSIGDSVRITNVWSKYWDRRGIVIDVWESNLEGVDQEMQVQLTENLSHRFYSRELVHLLPDVHCFMRREKPERGDWIRVMKPTSHYYYKKGVVVERREIDDICRVQVGGEEIEVAAHWLHPMKVIRPKTKQRKVF